MSYDLQVWASTPPELPAALPDSERWQPRDSVWVWANRGWQIVVGPVHRVEPDDVPPDVHAALPGVIHMVELNLEPCPYQKSGNCCGRFPLRVGTDTVRGSMPALLVALLAALRSFARSRLDLGAEILALRHQLAVLQRQTPTRPRLGRADRLLWVLLARLWPKWRDAI